MNTGCRRFWLSILFSRPNKNTLHYEAPVTDPGTYTKSFRIAWDIPWDPNGELLEYICQEKNQYLNHLRDDFGQPIFGPRREPGELPAREGDTR
ncbi:MAG: hypothetical protein HY655_04970 [Acidobacteria bacterium]|nr:hypothetical protein [Acidobacteriota bacterium]